LFLKARANECPGGTVLSAKGARERVCASRGLEGLAAGRLPAGRKTGEIDLYIVVVKKTFRYSNVFSYNHLYQPECFYEKRYKIDPPQADLKHSLFNRKKIKSIKNPRKATDTFRRVKVKVIANI